MANLASAFSQVSSAEERKQIANPLNKYDLHMFGLDASSDKFEEFCKYVNDSNLSQIVDYYAESTSGFADISHTTDDKQQVAAFKKYGRDLIKKYNTPEFRNALMNSKVISFIQAVGGFSRLSFDDRASLIHNIKVVSDIAKKPSEEGARAKVDDNVRAFYSKINRITSNRDAYLVNKLPYYELGIVFDIGTRHVPANA